MKTDGQRIVIVANGVLKVVDPRSRAVTGTLPLGDGGYATDLLLSGDHALLLMPTGGIDDVAGPRLMLVDVSGAPRILSSYAMDGSLRRRPPGRRTARVVVRSTPRLNFPQLENATGTAAAGRQPGRHRQAQPGDWLPRYAVTTGGKTTRGSVPCDAVSRPADYSGAATADPADPEPGRRRARLRRPGHHRGRRHHGLQQRAQPLRGQRQPLAGAADVSCGWSRTAARRSDPRRRPSAPSCTSSTPAVPASRSTSAPARYRATCSTSTRCRSGRATCAWPPRTATPRPSTCCAAPATTLREVGSVGGLGKGQRIYAVRFDAGAGYVVTFRQTDPLYTLDLRDAGAPEGHRHRWRSTGTRRTCTRWATAG